MSVKKTVKIRRNAREYLMLKGGVIETKQTESELEQAFRIRSGQYGWKILKIQCSRHMSQEPLRKMFTGNAWIIAV